MAGAIDCRTIVKTYIFKKLTTNSWYPGFSCQDLECVVAKCLPDLSELNLGGYVNGADYFLQLIRGAEKLRDLRINRRAYLEWDIVYINMQFFASTTTLSGTLDYCDSRSEKLHLTFYLRVIPKIFTTPYEDVMTFIVGRTNIF